MFTNNLPRAPRNVVVSTASVLLLLLVFIAFLRRRNG